MGYLACFPEKHFHATIEHAEIITKGCVNNREKAPAVFWG